MDVMNSPIFFLADLVLFVWFYDLYTTFTESIAAIQRAPVFGREVEAVLRTGGRVPNCVLEGSVAALEATITSSLKPGEATGVVQRLKVTRFFVSRDVFGILRHKTETVEDSVRVARFGIDAGRAVVELADTFAYYTDPWNRVDLERVGSVVKLNANSTSGIQLGMEYTEDMLKEGSYMMAFGELMLEGDVITLVPSSDGGLYFLSTSPRHNFVQWMVMMRNIYRMTVISSGSLAAFLIGRYAVRQWTQYEDAQPQQPLPLLVAMPDAPEVQLCVVCRYYARDVLLLPCRHFAVCQDCLPSVQRRCPVCRTPFTASIAVYVA